MHLTLLAAVWICSRRNKFDRKRYYFKHLDLNKITMIDFNLIKKETVQLSLAGSGVCVFPGAHALWLVEVVLVHCALRKVLLNLSLRRVLMHWWEETTWSSRPESQAAPSKGSALPRNCLYPRWQRPLPYHSLSLAAYEIDRMCCATLSQLCILRD